MNSAEKIKLGTWHKRIFYAVLFLLWLTGALWLYFHYFTETISNFGKTRNPLETLMLHSHGILAYLSLLILGSMFAHVKRGLTLKINLVSGLFLISTFTVLSITGLLLYYSGSIPIRNIASLAHWVIGIILPIVIFFHIRSGRARIRTLSIE